MYLNTFSCAHRENMAPASSAIGRLKSVVMKGTCRPVSSRRRICLTVTSPARVTVFSASRTVLERVVAGPWIGTSTSWKSASGQSSPLKFLCQVSTATPRRARRLNRAGLQPSRSKTRVTAGVPGRGRSSTPSRSSAGTTSCSRARTNFGSNGLCRQSSGWPPSALTQ